MHRMIELIRSRASGSANIYIYIIYFAQQRASFRLSCMEMFCGSNRVQEGSSPPFGWSSLSLNLVRIPNLTNGRLQAIHKRDERFFRTSKSLINAIFTSCSRMALAEKIMKDQSFVLLDNDRFYLSSKFEIWPNHWQLLRRDDLDREFPCGRACRIGTS